MPSMAISLRTSDGVLPVVLGGEAGAAEAASDMFSLVLNVRLGDEILPMSLNLDLADDDGAAGDEVSYELKFKIDFVDGLAKVRIDVVDIEWEEGVIGVPLTLATSSGPMTIPVSLMTAMDSVYGMDGADEPGEVHEPFYLFLRCSDSM